MSAFFRWKPLDVLVRFEQPRREFLFGFDGSKEKKRREIEINIEKCH